MARPRTISDMIAKYYLKYSGDNVTATWTAVKPLMESRYEAGSSPIYNAVEAAREVLTREGVPTGEWARYIAFAQVIAKLAFSHSGAVLQKEVSGAKSYFQLALGADPTILDKIIEAIVGVVPAY